MGNKQYLIWISFLFLIFFACVKEDAQSKYSAAIDAEQLIFFEEQIFPILESKCNTCHDYHNTLSSEYTTFEKTAGNIENILGRISSGVDLDAMPPPSSEQLTISEIQQFKTFRDLLKNTSTDLKINFKWTAFKYPSFNDRVAVRGTFDKMNWFINEDASNIYDKLDGAELIILTSSVNLGGSELRSTNVREYFFSKLTPTIHCKILSINTEYAIVSITMNGINRAVSLDISIDENAFNLSGTILDLHEFNLSSAFDSLDEVCGIYHDNFVWPDIKLELSIENFDKL